MSAITPNHPIAAPRLTTMPPVLGDHLHAVQFYSKEEFVFGEISRFLGTSLGAGHAAIAIATPSHLEDLARGLKTNGFDIARLGKEGRYVALNAEETLSKISREGALDWQSFLVVIGGHVTRARAATGNKQSTVAVFGEMVALLWANGKCEDAVRLEQFWNELAKTHLFSLSCAYPIGSFSQEEHGDAFLKICKEHTLVIPGESYTLLAGEEQRMRGIAYLQQRAEALESEIALRHSEERFRLFVESVRDYAIFMLDPEGRVITWNTGAEKIKGYRASEIVGQHFSRFYPEEEVRSEKPQRELEIAVKEGRFEEYGWRLRKDGSRFWANVIITALHDENGHLYGFGKVTRDFTERMAAETALQQSQQKLQQSERSLRELSLHLLRTQDEERRRIGREMHDSLGQYLAVLKMKLDAIQFSTELADGDFKKDLAECAGLANDCVKDVRTISYLLYPPLLEERGLKSAVPWYLDGFTKRSGIQTTFEISPNFDRLPRDTELALFRILQEALTNAHRHSGSSTADVRLYRENGFARLEVKDYGNGAPHRSLDPSGRDWMDSLGVGVRGMDERMRQIGGTLEISSSGEGTIVRATAPVTGPGAPDPGGDSRSKVPA
jgi:PAS domain S-box-containing protein